MAGRYDAYVYKRGVKYKVRPAVSFGIAGAPFSFRNLTDKTVNFGFPDDLMEKDTPWQIAPRQAKTFTIKTTANGFYSYTVTYAGKGKKRLKAYGESDPGMIVDP
jgi:hypothetical protein